MSPNRVVGIEVYSEAAVPAQYQASFRNHQAHREVRK
jgi:hypothetical protein